LGADGTNRLAQRGCEYLLTHAPANHGGFSAYADTRPSGEIHCLNGNLIWALATLGYGDDARVKRAVDWLAGAITGDDFGAFNSLTPGPGFKCGANMKQPCAWGAVKALRALAALPKKGRDARTKKATEMAVEFLLSRDLAQADYPYTARVSGEWFKFGFPLSYTSDVLEALLALAQAGRGSDPRLKNAAAFVLSKQDAQGRWAMKQSQRQDVDRHRRERQAEQMGDASRAVRVESHLPMTPEMLRPWKTLSRKTILNHSKWLVVEDHVVELPDGRVIEHWPWIITPDYINVVVVTESGKFLFFRQTKYAVGGMTLAPVGGYLEPGEEPLAAAQRELLEETGYAAPDWVGLGTYHVDSNRGAGSAHLFLARGAHRVQERHADDLEEQELVHLTRGEVEAALAAGEFKVLAWVTVVALGLLHLKD
jgi:ADP-ribose pyrophosphatase